MTSALADHHRQLAHRRFDEFFGSTIGDPGPVIAFENLLKIVGVSESPSSLGSVIA
jgi:hypothetical protein